MPGSKVFWSGMLKRAFNELKLSDKLIIGNIDTLDPDYADIEDLRDFIIMSPLRKAGYRWIKGEGNKSRQNWEVGDEFIGVGTLFPGYVVHGYIKNAAMTNLETDVTLLNATPL
ncbi:hypothetical protein [Croceivirga sp. JEA036]|uniref:hypothetical protein n=1 Tax=Croceivirga sp. JEA036 TaxID=2721162 RepID=UPI00143913AE|nr:hypothetical protein [Croceivirga sp. JEA036]NJB36393.1 hypothetical protein [Croceivirga sp. JEA036]